MKPAVNNKCFSYWSYILVYVDDYLAVYHDPGPIMEDLKSRYKLNNDMYRESENYLGANVGTYQLKHNGGKSYWSMNVYGYVVELCKMVRERSVSSRRKFNKKHEDAMKENYCPEIDILDELGDELATQFQ